MDSFRHSIDIDTLADLLEEDELQLPPATSVATPPESESDILKKKLEDMEKQMALLKDQLRHQNTSSTSSTPPVKSLKDVGLDFNQPSQQAPVAKGNLKSSDDQSLVHTQESVSSEDEDGNTGSKYNEFGQFVKQRLAHQPAQVDRIKGQNCPQGWKAKQGALTKLSSGSPSVKAEAQSNDNGFTDPFFGIKIINPLIGSSTLMQKMEGRKQIKVSQIKANMRGGDINDDWVTLAIIVSKSEPRTSQKGKKYSIWKLSDLKDCTKQVSFFLFGEVFTTHWKMAVGSVIGILNPNFMKENNNKDEISFTVDHHHKVLHVGGSKVSFSLQNWTFILLSF